MLESNKIDQVLTYCYPIVVPMRNGIHDVPSISTEQSWILESLPL